MGFMIFLIVCILLFGADAVLDVAGLIISACILTFIVGIIFAWVF